MVIRLLLMLVLSVPVVACNHGKEGKAQRNVPGKQEMADLNRYLVRKDRERIENYIARKDLQMKENESGLWYLIRSEGSGEKFKENDRLLLEYECTLLDGTFCYSSEDSGPKEVVLGRSRIESGLDQGLRMLRSGGQAIFIIPSFLGWGFPGDGNRIPTGAIVVYDIKNVRRP